MNTQFIEFLARHGAVSFGEFTLKSGRISPYFIDLGVLSGGSAITELGKILRRQDPGKRRAEFRRGVSARHTRASRSR